MATSVSQASAGGSNWNRVYAGYRNKNVPHERVVAEVWKASENQANPLSSELKSDTVFAVYQAVASASDFPSALNSVNEHIIKNGGNSITVEFAKRSIPVAFTHPSPVEAWARFFISEVTKYVVARDAAGFVGPRYRNKTIGELTDFKNALGIVASNKVQANQTIINSPREWKKFIDSVTENLTNA